VLSKYEFEKEITRLYRLEPDEQIDGETKIRTAIIFPPEFEDLYRLYSYVIDNCVISILEFGSGWSTLAFAMAMSENKMRYAETYPNFHRNPHPFKLCSVDNSQAFLTKAISRIGAENQGLVIPWLASPHLRPLNGIPVTEWLPVPRIDYDLIYIDAPEPEQVLGSDQMIEIATIHDLPMAADILINEPYILPQTSILIDGRTSNARFLQANCYRNWESVTQFNEDYTHMFLKEDPLGKINKAHIDFRLANSLNGTLSYVRELDTNN
jgi:hypothetical protein